MRQNRSMSSPPCQAQIASLSECYAALRSAVDKANEALHALGAVQDPSDAQSEAFLAADHRVSVIVREITAILDR